MLTEVTVAFPNSVVWHITPDQLNLETLQEVFNSAGVVYAGAQKELARDLLGDILNGSKPKMVYDTPIGPVVIHRTIELVQINGVFQQPKLRDILGLRPLANLLSHPAAPAWGVAVAGMGVALYILSLTAGA